MKLRVRSSIALVAALQVVAGCGDQRALERSASSATARQLAGAWDILFHLDLSPVLTLDAARAPREIAGRIVLLVNRSVAHSYGRMGVPTNYGSYDIDLSRYGFDPRISSVTPTVVAGSMGADSVELLLSPHGESEGMVMRGRISADTVRGVWNVSQRASGGEGTFVMTRSAKATIAAPQPSQ